MLSKSPERYFQSLLFPLEYNPFKCILFPSTLMWRILTYNFTLYTQYNHFYENLHSTNILTVFFCSNPRIKPLSC